MDVLPESRDAIVAELRRRLALPEWSNLRGDDVISIIESLDEASRQRVNLLFCELREIDDAGQAGGAR